MTTHGPVPSAPPRAQYVADGEQTVFPFPFLVLKAADLQVFVGPDPVASGFAVAGLGDPDGGAVTFAAPPPPGRLVTLRRKLTIERLSDFQEGGAFRAKVINDELDFLTMALQEVETDLLRAARLAPTASAGLDVTLPAPAPGKAIGWSDDGLRLVTDPSDFTSTVATVQQWAANADGALRQAMDSATAAADSAATAATARDGATAGATAAAASGAAAAAAANGAATSADAARAAAVRAEAQAASAAFDAFTLRADRAGVLAAAEDASSAAAQAIARAAEALNRLEDVDLSLWRADRAATRAEAAAARAEAATDLPPAGITPGAVLPNWARIDT